MKNETLIIKTLAIPFSNAKEESFHIELNEALVIINKLISQKKYFYIGELTTSEDIFMFLEDNPICANRVKEIHLKINSSSPASSVIKKAV